MKVKKRPAPLLLLYLVISIPLTVINYFIGFNTIYFLFGVEEFNVSYFLGLFLILIVAESAYIGYATKNKLFATLGSSTIIAWLIATVFFGYYGIFSQYGSDLAHYLRNTKETLEHIALNIMFLFFSYLGALIGIGFKTQEKFKKTR